MLENIKFNSKLRITSGIKQGTFIITVPKFLNVFEEECKNYHSAGEAVAGFLNYSSKINNSNATVELLTPETKKYVKQMTIYKQTSKGGF